MLNFLKKVEESKQEKKDLGDTNAVFEPPKNLPDLAKDIYERERPNFVASDVSSSANNVKLNAIKINEDKDRSFGLSKVTEPSTNSVPKLDLSLVRDQLNSSSTNPSLVDSGTLIKQTMPKISQSNLLYNPTLSPTSNVVLDSVNATAKNIDYVTDNNTQLLQQILQLLLNQQLNYSRDFSHSNNGLNVLPQVPASMISNGSYTNLSNNFAKIPNSLPGANSDNSIANNSILTYGFFKEFEEYVKKNGFDNDVIELILDKNLLDNMVYYHTLKRTDVPFYYSDAEYSHAIKLRLEELQSLEKNWILNKSKLDLLKQLGSTIESEVHLKSEELKKMMKDSKKITRTIKSGDFFQIMQPKSDVPRDVSESIGVSTVSSSSNSDKLQLDAIRIKEKYSKNFLEKYAISDSSKYFYAKNGLVFTSFIDLIYGLKKMDDTTFNYHANNIKNDFSVWINDIFDDDTLSNFVKSFKLRNDLIHYFEYLFN
ncbi:MAG: hypothetical protein ACP5N1_04090 [Candidatus Woesearchaeota archaeon]